MAHSSESTETSPIRITDPNSLNPLLNPLSPLAIHQNDNSAVAIVLDPLVGRNFVSWSHAICRGLSVKNKLQLIDGSLKTPVESDDHVIHAAGVRANNLVLMWILNSIFPEIKKTLEYFQLAKEVWEELHIRYACSDLTRVYHLEKSLSAITQGDKSLVGYYNEFKSLWDEYLSYRPVFKSSCGAMASCVCDLPQLLSKSQEQDCVMKFFTGLHESYLAIRSQLLLQSPFPPLAKVYSLLIQEESQGSLYIPPASVPNDSIAMLANKGKYYKDNKKLLICSHCNTPGHTVDRCFQLIGYPPSWRGPKGPRHKSDKPVQGQKTSANVLVPAPASDVSPMESNPLFTQELFEQFLSFAKIQKKPSDPVHTSAGAFTHVTDSMPGDQHTQSDWYC